MDEATSTRELAQAALSRIEAAFADRAPPTVMTTSRQLSDLEYAELSAFEGQRWQDVDSAQVERCADAIFWFSPEAFCYYLPGFLAAGLRTGRRDSNAYDAIFGMLDRSPVPEYWDDFFAPRWTLLRARELEAVRAWVRWFETAEPHAFHHNTYPRAQATLDLLRARAPHTPG